MSEYPIPEEKVIQDAISGLSEKAQKALTRTVWKDGIDIEEPSYDAKMFAKWIAEPYIERIAKQDAEIDLLSKALTCKNETVIDLEKENVSLKAQVERLGAPLSDEEWKYRESEYLNDKLSLPEWINTIIASRAAKEKPCTNKSS